MTKTSHVQQADTTETKFLDALAAAEHKAGVYLFKGFVSDTEADELFVELNDDTKVPWDLKPVIGGERLTSHACDFQRTEKEIRKWSGFAILEDLCKRVEERLDGTVTDVFCNRFRDQHHNLPWHRDTYGHHIVILSLGSRRKIQFRDFKTRTIVDVQPQAGDAYFMPLRLNETHEHQVCAAEGPDDGARISIVFFFKPPKYAKEFKISTGQKVIGFLSALLD